MLPIELCIEVAGARAADVIQTAVAVEQAGFAGVTFSDELCDVAGNGTWSHEPWTLMAATAAVTERVRIGSLVLNVANRDPGTTAVAAASLQDLARGRLWLGMGAGTDRTSPFARDQLAFGRPPAGAAARREAVRSHFAAIRRIWDNTTDGFLRPDPLPPLILGAFGPKTAHLAGEVADGIACPLDGFGEYARPLEELVEIARRSFTEAGRTGSFTVLAHTGPYDSLEDPQWKPGGSAHDRLAAAGVDRLELFVRPSAAAVARAAEHLQVDAVAR